MNLKDFWVIWLSKLYKKYERFNKKILRKRQKMVHFALGAREQKFPQKSRSYFSPSIIMTRCTEKLINGSWENAVMVELTNRETDMILMKLYLKLKF